MYQQPVIIGVRQTGGWNTGETVQETLSHLGLNTGNMIFTESLVRVLRGASWCSFELRQQDLHGKDVIVLAAANWINSYDDMGWLADRLERTSLPIVMVGIGAQSTSAMELPVVRPGTMRLLSLVRDRSTSIAARGAFTCDVLNRYGIKTGVVTGCPSLLLAGSQGPRIRTTGGVHAAVSCMHATRHGFQQAEPFQAYLYQQAYRQRMQIVLQSELADIYLALGKINNLEITARAINVVRSVYADDDVVTLERYLRTHGHVFTNLQDWLHYMATRSFCFGTRIHGVVASLLAGTEATLIAHDSRTLEMAHSMFLPHITSSEILTEGNLDVNRLHQPEQTAGFMACYRDYHARYVAYFTDNGLAVDSGINL
ncbi:MAG: polysaccharide pyruvyl transferase family protein [Janthinobacterium lividum]